MQMLAMSRTSTERHLPSNEPVSTNGKDLAVGSADTGQPQRIRKVRGFTQKYGYARPLSGIDIRHTQPRTLIACQPLSRPSLRGGSHLARALP
jgi:hypothetical protein